MNRKLYYFDDWRKHLQALVDHFKDGDDSPLTKEEIIEISNFIKTQLIIQETKHTFPSRE
jgi:hypothetical protein